MENIEKFIEKFAQNVHFREWHPTQRAGNTGIGYTLESLLGIKENNRTSGDWGEYELKSGRVTGNSALTLFTKSPNLHSLYVPRTVRPTANKEMLQSFGYATPRGTQIHATLYTQRDTILPNGKIIRLNIEQDEIQILGDGEVVAFWSKEVIQQTLSRKFAKSSIIYVSAKSRINTGGQHLEEFSYTDVDLWEGIDMAGVLAAIRNDDLAIELRIGSKPDGRVHDHGTAFRIRKAKMNSIFQRQQIIASPWRT